LRPLAAFVAYAKANQSKKQYGFAGAGSANPACVLLNNITMTTPPPVEELGATICLKTRIECTNSPSLAPAEDAYIFTV